VIAFDTNLLVRSIVVDDPEQLDAFVEALGQADAAGEKVFLPWIVLCEAAWVLRSSYRVSRPEIASALRLVLADARFEVERRELVERALARFESGRGGFGDYLIGEVASAEGARTTKTFDRRLRNEAGLTLV
jgi:predicted nucleic-acid-binding protein